jgi:hypothetical protein
MRYLLFIFLLGCSEVHTFKLNNGEIVFCKDWLPQTCGISLWSCDTGKDYYCQTNVEEVILLKEFKITSEKPSI